MATIGKTDQCTICRRPVNHVTPQHVDKAFEFQESVKKRRGYFWTYLYHRNVPKCTPSEPVTTSGSNTLSPALSFSLSGGAIKYSDDDDHKLCENCGVELERLNILHQELEAIKTRIQLQVGVINGRRCSLDRTKDGITVSSNKPPLSGMSMNGSVAGKDNLLETLRFLDKLCQGMGSPLQTIHLQPSIPTITTTTPITLASKPEVPNVLIVDPEDLELEGHDAVFKEEIEDDDDDVIILSDDDSSPDPGDPSDQEVWNKVPDNEDDETTIHLEGYSISNPPVSLQDPLGTSSGSAPPPPPKPKIPRMPPKYREPQVCSVCGKVVKGSQLIKHMWLHRGGKSYECQFCGRKSADGFAHKIHLRSHTGERPFACHLCGSRFIRQNCMKRHLRTVHGAMPPSSAGDQGAPKGDSGSSSNSSFVQYQTI